MRDFQYEYGIIGGDRRQGYLAQEFSAAGTSVCGYAIDSIFEKEQSSADNPVKITLSLAECLENSNCVIGPIPFGRNNQLFHQSKETGDIPFQLLLSHLKPDQSFFAGCIPDGFKAKAAEKGVHIFDLMEETSLSVLNSIATAEGAISEAIQKSPLNLHQSRCAVLGYGKCGRTLTEYLQRMFCHVYTVSEIEHERILASLIADETGTLQGFADCAGTFDFIFNTIPAPVIMKRQLSDMKNSVTIIDIASAPGGVDFEAAKELGKKAFLCQGLPGKYAPYSSAKIIKTVIERIRKEL